MVDSSTDPGAAARCGASACPRPPKQDSGGRTGTSRRAQADRRASYFLFFRRFRRSRRFLEPIFLRRLGLPMYFLQAGAPPGGAVYALANLRTIRAGPTIHDARPNVTRNSAGDGGVTRWGGAGSRLRRAGVDEVAFIRGFLSRAALHGQAKRIPLSHATRHLPPSTSPASLPAAIRGADRTRSWAASGRDGRWAIAWGRGRGSGGSTCPVGPTSPCGPWRTCRRRRGSQARGGRS